MKPLAYSNLSSSQPIYSTVGTPANNDEFHWSDWFWTLLVCLLFLLPGLVPVAP